MNMMAGTENVTKELSPFSVSIHFHVIFNCIMYQSSKCHELHFDQMQMNEFVCALFVQYCVLTESVSV